MKIWLDEDRIHLASRIPEALAKVVKNYQSSDRGHQSSAFQSIMRTARMVRFRKFLSDGKFVLRVCVFACVFVRIDLDIFFDVRFS